MCGNIRCVKDVLPARDSNSFTNTSLDISPKAILSAIKAIMNDVPESLIFRWFRVLLVRSALAMEA